MFERRHTQNADTLLGYLKKTDAKNAEDGIVR